MMEEMGVTDPECDKVPGRLFTAVALKNLVSDGSELPELVLHRGSLPGRTLTSSFQTLF